MVGRPVQHASANKQATGEARYVDDIPHIEGNWILVKNQALLAHCLLNLREQNVFVNWK